MEQMTDKTIAFIGLGLIGGSIARGIKRARPDIHIMAYMRTRSKLEQAQRDGVIDEILDGIDSRLSQCSLIFLCTPVEYNAQYLTSIRSHLKPGALITDVGSTKTNIHEEVQALGLTDSFVGGHPMAGSEKTGYENSTDHLLENAYYIITPPMGLEGNADAASSPSVQRIVQVCQRQRLFGPHQDIQHQQADGRRLYIPSRQHFEVSFLVFHIRIISCISIDGQVVCEEKCPAACRDTFSII